MRELRPRLWAITLPFLPAVPTSACYALVGEDGGVHLIDSGADTSENRERLAAALAALGAGLDDVASLTATHLHRDHAGLAAWLGRRNGLAVRMHPLDAADLADGSADTRYSTDLDALGERWGVPLEERHRLELKPPPATPVPERIEPLHDGQRLDLGDRVAHVLHTPGHTRGHVCLDITGDGLLLTGDHLLPGIAPGLGRGGGGGRGRNPVADYLDSLERIAPLRREAAPGHGEPFPDVARRAAELRAHVLSRAAEVDSTSTAAPDATVWQVAAAIGWRQGWAALSPSHTQSALAQTEMYLDFVRGR